MHICRIIVHGVTNGIGGIVVVFYRFNQGCHRAGHHGGGHLHHGLTLHHQFLHHHLAACRGVALEGFDGCVIAAHLRPVGDFTGVNILELPGRQIVYRIVFIDHKHQRLGGNLLDLIAKMCLFHFVKYLALWLCGNHNIAVALLQITEGLGGAVELHQRPGLLPVKPQQDAGNARPQGNKGRRAVHAGEILPGELERGCRLRLHRKHQQRQHQDDTRQTFHKQFLLVGW